jgi:hypothetical protein
MKWHLHRYGRALCTNLKENPLSVLHLSADASSSSNFRERDDDNCRIGCRRGLASIMLQFHERLRRFWNGQSWTTAACFESTATMTGSGLTNLGLLSRLTEHEAYSSTRQPVAMVKAFEKRAEVDPGERQSAVARSASRAMPLTIPYLTCVSSRHATT